ncbi:hypothetical protein [Yersinia sp. Marseille-Q3913]|uniref:hypothetical protein n=1 Tax=Yersinia sp. Marseille-Q3913 TaxID=2830769 RepID=UPI001BAF3727|nr:hypothetical protein [Yersinia sp. Marseille-Q3913]MBS0054497.1 hypothetical protein [Yersinia sp. Marseille-Q3913]
MFQFIDFDRVLRTDNPTYERILCSDLHAVINLVRHGWGTFRVEQLASEMKKISAIKWQKYLKTKQYLIRECPGLHDQLRPQLINFRTFNLTAGAAGAIDHTLIWQSDTGVLGDLAHIRVREKVCWQAPEHRVLPYVINEYRQKGVHYGVGNAIYMPGNTGQGNDTHTVLGPFSPKMLNFGGPGELEFVITQTYQQSNDGGRSWTDIPDSTYRIRRIVRCAGTKLQLTIYKENLSNPCDALSNMTEV